MGVRTTDEVRENPDHSHIFIIIIDNEGVTINLIDQTNTLVRLPPKDLYNRYILEQQEL
jgi:hypothetical protein